MKIFFLIALRNIVQRRVRSLMLVGAIVGVSFLFTLLLSLVYGVKDAMIRNGTALMTGHLNIAGFYKISQSSANPIVTKYEPLVAYAKAKIPEAEVIVDRVKAFGKVFSETDSAQIPFWGVNMEQEGNVLSRLEVAADEAGKALGSVASLRDRGGIAIFQTHAKKLKVGIGDSVTVSVPTYRNMNNTKDVKIIAILKDLGIMSQFNAYMHAADVRELYQHRPDSTGQIMIYLKDVTKLPEVEERVRQNMTAQGHLLMEKESNPFWMKFDRVAGESWTGQKIDVTTWEDETSFLKWVVGLLSALAWVLTIVLSIIIVMGLMNALWMSIKERTTEIGTLRAIGMQRSKVLVLFLMESLIISVFSTVVGLLLASVFVKTLNAMKIPITDDAFQMFLMANHLSFLMNPSLLITCFGFLVGFFTLGSLIPAYQATRLSPILAINQS